MELIGGTVYISEKQLAVSQLRKNCFLLFSRLAQGIRQAKFFKKSFSSRVLAMLMERFL